jgi:hypothetical protein
MKNIFNIQGKIKNIFFLLYIINDLPFKQKIALYKSHNNSI